MCRWVGLAAGVAAASCLAESKSGGEIVDETSGSMTDESDGEDAVTDDGSSGDTGAAPSCSEDPAPSCGDGVVDALEDCDGTTECNACDSTRVQTTLIDDGGGIGPMAIAADGSSFGITESQEGAEHIARRYDPSGNEIWQVSLADDESVTDVAVDGAGNAYVSGALRIDVSSPDSNPWIGSWDAAGTPRWSVELPGLGTFLAIATSGDRVAVVGFDQDEEYTARLQLVDDVGAEVWSAVDSSLVWMEDVAFVGTELAVIGSGPDALMGGDDVRLVRYDEAGNARWSVALPEDGEPSQRGYGVIADGADGTWAFGEAATGPYVAHHDRDGDLLEEIGCIGGATGWVEYAALDDQNRLALAILVQLNPDEIYTTHAWFPIIEDGNVAWAATLTDSDTGAAGPFAVGWRSDGALVVGWTDYGSEGGPGQSELLLLPP